MPGRCLLTEFMLNILDQGSLPPVGDVAHVCGAFCRTWLDSVVYR